ncbi:hypothetical protein CTI12_AA176400 [Artemisia annua]|uniref:Uncharacterized protein n=1 Tax=Artemisia annua TaxID=35608 RepID=A0A2U1PA59_ARTAN|nr:hypothetical protein CTI12_AA176400 [Artemisia annua]
MNQVLSQGPWMVNSRPMFVQKWDPEIGMIKVEPVKLPVWVRLQKIPIEAWSMEGKLSYARVMVEIKAGKELKEIVKIEYIDKDKNVKGTKENDGFTDVQPKKKSMNQQWKNGQYRNYGAQGERQMYRKKDGGNGKGKEKMHEGITNSNHNRSGGSNVNRYEVLNNDTDENRDDARIMKDRMIVDDYLNKKMQPTCTELKNWTKDMEEYFKKQWKIDRLKEKEDAASNVEDVMEGVIMADFNVTMKAMEHSAGGSMVKNDMHEFIDYVNEIEVEDLCSSGVFYTWIKSPTQPHTSILKKLDRAVVNE